MIWRNILALPLFPAIYYTFNCNWHLLWSHQCCNFDNAKYRLNGGILQRPSMPYLSTFSIPFVFVDHTFCCISWTQTYPCLIPSIQSFCFLPRGRGACLSLLAPHMLTLRRDQIMAVWYFLELYRTTWYFRTFRYSWVLVGDSMWWQQCSPYVNT